MKILPGYYKSYKSDLQVIKTREEYGVLDHAQQRVVATGTEQEMKRLCLTEVCNGDPGDL
jgi:hypothetical protein